jgi:hypothetical protein
VVAVDTVDTVTVALRAMTSLLYLALIQTTLKFHRNKQHN